MKENLPPSDDSISIAGATLTDSRPLLVDLSQLFTPDKLREISRKYQEGIFRGTMKRLNKGEIVDPRRIEFCLGCIDDQDLRTELEAHPYWLANRKNTRGNIGGNYP